EVMPSPYEEGFDLGRALYRQSIPLARVRLSMAADTFGYAGELARRWKQGVIDGYVAEMEAKYSTRGARAHPERTGLTVVNERLRRKLKEAWRERSAAMAEALTAQASLRRVERELEEARNHARRLCVALRAIRDEAAIGGPPLESRREDWEAALREADEALGELEALYGG